MKKKALLFLTTFLCALIWNIAQAGPGTFPQGDHVKLMKNRLEFKTIPLQIMVVDYDPIMVAVDTASGSLVMRASVPKLYIKQDDGSSTNFVEMLDGNSISDNAYSESGWNGETLVAPSKNAIRDKVVLIDSDISTLESNLATATASIEANSADIAQNISNINTLESNMATATASIENNANDIAKNISDINTIESNLATATAAIESNDADILTLQNDVANIDIDITGIIADIFSATSAIESNDLDISNIQGDIADIRSDIATATAAIEANTDDITDNALDIIDNAVAITSLQNNLATATAAIESNDADITSIQLGQSATTATIALNSSHRLGDGSDHSNVAQNTSDIIDLQTVDSEQTATIALNSAHRLGDGSDHSDVVVNNSHRVDTSIHFEMLDDDSFATATNGKTASSESIKAYVDTEIAAIPQVETATPTLIQDISADTRVTTAEVEDMVRITANDINMVDITATMVEVKKSLIVTASASLEGLALDIPSKGSGKYLKMDNDNGGIVATTVAPGSSVICVLTGNGHQATVSGDLTISLTVSSTNCTAMGMALSSSQFVLKNGKRYKISAGATLIGDGSNNKTGYFHIYSTTDSTSLIEGASLRENQQDYHPMYTIGTTDVLTKDHTVEFRLNYSATSGYVGYAGTGWSASVVIEEY